MSAAEMKQIMLDNIKKLEDEQLIESAFSALGRIGITQTKEINLSQHYKKISAQFNDTLKKLAQ